MKPILYSLVILGFLFLLATGQAAGQAGLAAIQAPAQATRLPAGQAVRQAADTLSVNEAIVTALEQNFGITLAENNKEIAEISNTIGAAGMLPRLDMTGTRSLSVNNSKQEYYDGRLREGKNAKSNNKNAGLQLTWTLFDGFNMFIQKARLTELENLSDIQLRSVIENTVTQVINTYYEIVAQEALKKVYEDAVKVSEARKAFTKARYGLGSDSELSVLQATVDLNTDSANLIRQTALIGNLKADLNYLLCRETVTPFDVTRIIPLNKILTLSDLSDRTNRENPDLLAARNAITLASLSVREAKSAQMPRLNLNSGYSFSLSTSDVGLMISNRNYGYTVGVTLSYNIFNGLTTKQKINTARIRENSADIELKNAELEIDVHLRQVYNDYLTNLRLVEFETESLGFARHSFRVAEEKFRLGSLNDIEFREVQAKMLEAENRLLSAIYRSKLAETELLRISGQISGNTF